MKTPSISGFAKQRWAAILAVLVVAVLGFTMYRLHGIFGSDNVVSRTGDGALDDTGYSPRRVRFEVFGSPGSTATINFKRAAYNRRLCRPNHRLAPA